MESSEYAWFRQDGTGEGASRLAPVVGYEAIRDERVQAETTRTAGARAGAEQARVASRAGRFVVSQAVSDAADAALQAMSKRYTVARGRTYRVADGTMEQPK